MKINKVIKKLDIYPHNINSFNSWLYLKNSGYWNTEEVGNSLSCDKDDRLHSLKESPKIINGIFNCSGVRLHSLEGSPLIVRGNYQADNNELTSLKDIHKQIKEIHGTFSVRHNPIISNILGVLLIKNLEFFDISANHNDKIKINMIIDHHIQGDRDVLACQEELISAGYKEYAKL